MCRAPPANLKASAGGNVPLELEKAPFHEPEKVLFRLHAMASRQEHSVHHYQPVTHAWTTSKRSQSVPRIHKTTCHGLNLKKRNRGHKYSYYKKYNYYKIQYTWNGAHDYK